MMKRKYDIELFNEITRSHIDEAVDDTEFPHHVLASMADGETEFSLKRLTKTVKFDDLWIKVIENYIPSLIRITKNLKSTLRYDADIIPIEKTKRVDVDSIKHLLANTQYIQEINDQDEVLPQKLLSNLSEIEYGIYENRLIASLIQRLKRFVEHRIQAMRNHLDSVSQGEFNATSKFLFGETKYTVKLQIVEECDTFDEETLKYNLGIIERAEELDKHVSALLNTQFVQIMKRYRLVTPPIMKTQIILKNPDYRNGYLLWLFLDKNNHFELDSTTNPTETTFKSRYRMEIEQQLLLLFTMHLANEPTEYLENPVNLDDVTPKNLSSYLHSDSEFTADTESEIIRYLEQLTELERSEHDVILNENVVEETTLYETINPNFPIDDAPIEMDLGAMASSIETAVLDETFKADLDNLNQRSLDALKDMEDSSAIELNLEALNDQLIDLAHKASQIGMIYEQAITLEVKALEAYKEATQKLIDQAKVEAKVTLKEKLKTLEKMYQDSKKDALKALDLRYKSELDAIRKQLSTNKKRADDQLLFNERALKQKEKLRLHNAKRNLTVKLEDSKLRHKKSLEEKVLTHKQALVESQSKNKK
ncbi:hypothetical protein N7603_03080 [Acholeplasma vituli]|uniref:DUF2357 domain-containing protein n=1 Tax=Paracholeplasma vituli TaxID=69473 RepID=A0ABT2PUL0_9MOLU|nr:hypothetical protein [Paracholeplasma vituli]MCU0104634.1 hypothetical protein [Paracholeplasma vituli]